MGPSSEDYFKAVGVIASNALHLFGLKNFRLWCEGSGGEYGGEKITLHVKEQVEYSSWIQSDPHVKAVVKHTRRLPFAGGVNQHITVLRVVAIRAMQDDVIDEGKRLVAVNAPIYYKIRFVEAKRFVQYADFEENDLTTDFKAQEPEVHEAVNKLRAEYAAAKLPCPQVVLVGFNKDHQEIPS